MDDLTKINDGMSGRPSAAKGDRPPKADKPPKWDQRLSRAEVERAVGTLIRWTGDGHAREGLRDTPARVARAYEEWFAGYGEDPRQLMQRTFEEIGGYDEMVLLRDIRFVSHCEHHLGADGSAGVARADILRRQETFHSMATWTVRFGSHVRRSLGQCSAVHAFRDLVQKISMHLLGVLHIGAPH